MDRLKLMETFAAVVATGSLSRASKRLNVTSAMVTKRLQGLESDLGVQLLNRNTHRLSLTEIGATYHEECLRILGDIQQLDDRVRQGRRVARGDLHLMATRTFTETTLAPIIADFCAQYPAVALKISLMDRSMAPHATDLISGGFDLAIRTLSPTDTSLIARPLADMEQVLVASPAYLKARGTPSNPKDLATHNCLSPQTTLKSPSWELGGRDGVQKVAVLGSPQTNGTLIVREAVVRGLGIGLLRRDLVQQLLDEGKLRIVLADFPPLPKRFFAIYLGRTHQPRRVTLLIDFMKRCLRKRPKHRKMLQRGELIARTGTHDFIKDEFS